MTCTEKYITNEDNNIIRVRNIEYLMREREKGCQKAVATVSIKTSIFNLQYISHFCMDFYATTISRSSYLGQIRRRVDNKWKYYLVIPSNDIFNKDTLVS